MTAACFFSGLLLFTYRSQAAAAAGGGLGIDLDDLLLARTRGVV